MAVAKALDIPYETVRDLTVVKTESNTPGWLMSLLGASLLGGGIGLGSLFLPGSEETPPVPVPEIIETVPQVDVEVIPPTDG